MNLRENGIVLIGYMLGVLMYNKLDILFSVCWFSFVLVLMSYDYDWIMGY